MTAVPSGAAGADPAPSPRFFLAAVGPPLLAGVVALGLTWGTPEPHASISDQTLTLDGETTFRVPVRSILDLTLVPSVPRIVWRDRGAGWRAPRQGRFELAAVGPARLLVTDARAPCVRIRTEHDEVYFNLGRPAETERIYRELREVWLASRSP